MGVSIDEKTRELIFKISDVFFSMFSSYNAFTVEESLKNLPKKEKEMISLLYGLDGEHCLDYDEIADKYNIDIDEVDEIIDGGINKLKGILSRGNVTATNKFKTLIDKYGKDRVSGAFNQLDEEYKVLIQEYYVNERKTTLQKLASKYSLTVSAVYYKLNEGIKRLIDNIENRLRIVFYEKFDGFKKEQVDELLLTLNEQEQDIINSYYGLKDDKKKFE